MDALFGWLPVSNSVLAAANWIIVFAIALRQILRGYSVSGFSLAMAALLGLGVGASAWGMNVFHRGAPQKMDLETLRWVDFALTASIDLAFAIVLGLVITAAVVERRPPRA